MELKQYQEKAVDDLVKEFNRKRDGSKNNYIIFKSPTGSGKTIMMAAFLKRIILNNDDKNTAFIWVAPRDLHNQSKSKILQELKNFNYRILDKDSIAPSPFMPNDIFFLNWEKGIKKTNGVWNNILVRENETERNLQDIMNKTREAKRNVVLIVDESHQGLYAQRTQEFVNEIIQPNTIIMVSATPKDTPQDINSVNRVDVNFSDVIDSGLIRKDTIINADLEKIENISEQKVADLILEASLKKQAELKELNPQIMPLILVQLPNESGNLSQLDKNTKDFIETFLSKQNITYDNGKLAVWLSGEKKNLENILDFNSKVQVLIFKQAIALGWDCPRAQILAMFRENKSETFQIQTVGRILRMPQAKHYENDKLNSAYLYSAIDQIIIGETGDTEKGYFNFNTMKITDLAKENNITLPSVYLNRTDFHDLTKEYFSPILKKNLLDAFGIEKSDLADAIAKKIDNKLEIYDEELKRDIIINEVIGDLENYDGTTSNIDKIQANSSYEEIEYIFEQFLRKWCLPYGPERSKAKIKNCLYEVFEMANFAPSVVKKFIVCSKANYEFINNIIQNSKDDYEPIRNKVDEDKREKTEYFWSLPESDIVNESYRKESFNKYALSPCFVKYDSELESKFAKYIDENENVLWWYKNGKGYGKYFGVLYKDAQNKERSFYPDFIVKLNNGIIGIFDTKTGITAEIAKEKSESLQKYMRDNKDKKLFGGLVKLENDIWKIEAEAITKGMISCNKETQFDEPQAKYDAGKWKKLEI